MHEITKEDIQMADGYTYKICRRLGIMYPDEDAIQTGRLGICIANAKFDPSKSKKPSFKKYAFWWVRATLYRNYFGFNRTGNNPRPTKSKKSDIYYNATRLNENSIYNSSKYSCNGTHRKVEAKQLWDKSMKILRPNEKQAVIDRFAHRMKFREMADKHGFTKEWHRQIYNRAILRLKRAYTDSA